MLFELSSLAQEIAEANEICRLMERNVVFKQVYVRSKRDDEDAFDSSKFEPDELQRRGSFLEVEEKLQIKVTNKEKGSVIIWEIEQF